MGRFLGLSILSLSFVFLFQNCQSFESKPVEELSSQCKAKLKEKVLAEGGWSEMECLKPSHYRCALKVYNPLVANSEYMENECIDWEGTKLCLDLDVVTRNTSELLDNPRVKDEAFLEGGAFNRLEYRCSQTGIVGFGHPLIVEVSDSLDGALVKAKSSCRKGVRL